MNRSFIPHDHEFTVWHIFNGTAGMANTQRIFSKIYWPSTIGAASLAGILFSIPAFFYIYYSQFGNTWLLYAGNFLFLSVIFIHTIRENKKRGEDESTVALSFISHVATILGMVIACLICFLLLTILLPGYLTPGMTEKTLEGEPANLVIDKTGGTSLQVFMSATIINFAVGSFCGIILPFYSKRNQTKDRREPTPLHNKGD